MKQEIENALIEAGFKKEGSYFRKKGDSIQISENETISTMFVKLIKHGMQLKCWEVQGVIGIVTYP